jgi:hypothetical protein
VNRWTRTIIERKRHLERVKIRREIRERTPAIQWRHGHGSWQWKDLFVWRGKGTESTPFRAVRRVGRLYNQRSCAGSNHIYNRVRRPRGGVKATGR